MQLSPPPLNRIYGIDLARSIAIFLFIIGHSITAYGTQEYVSSEVLQLLLRMAPPTFIIVFGAFLELVYASNLAKHGMYYVAKRLLSRAIQCYTLYVLSCFVLALREGYSVSYVVRMALMLGATPYTDILKFYTVILVLSPLMLMIKTRFGLAPLIAFCLATHAIHAAFYPLPYVQGFPGSEILSGFLYGATTVIAGPSVIHGITFVVAGMWLGKFLRNNLDRASLLIPQKPDVIYIFALFSTLFALSAVTYQGHFMDDLSGMTLRNSNSYIYFIFGIPSAILLIDLSMRLSKAIGIEMTKKLVFLGNTSLFTFCFGNCALYLTMRSDLEAGKAVAATFASIAFIVSLSWMFNQFKSRVDKIKTPGRLLSAYRYVAKGYADRMAGAMLKKLKTSSEMKLQTQ